MLKYMMTLVCLQVKYVMLLNVKQYFTLPHYTNKLLRLFFKTIMAHGVHLKDDELELLQKRGTSIAHCPASNTMLHSGLCDVRRLLFRGIKVGLGTGIKAN